MTSQTDKAAAFKAMHKAGDALVLVNVWDAGSAIIAAKSGAAAVATGSHGIANAHGLEDGQNCPFEFAINTVLRIADAVDAPITHDVERGWGETPNEVGQSCARVIHAGAVGINIEDSLETKALRDVDQQCERLSAARAEMDRAVKGSFINARCDALRPSADKDMKDQVAEAIKRAKRYADAGADGLFVPFTADLKIIAQICDASPIPVNVMRALDGPSITDYNKAGVARISHGPHPYFAAMNAFKAIADEIYEGS